MRMARRGFTLIELLVVIGIIGLLMGIAFPAFSMVRAGSRNAVCTSNLRQLDTPIRAYSHSNGDRIPIANMLPAVGLHGPESGLPQLLKGYIDPTSEVWLCPADLDSESLATGTSYMYMPGLLRFTPEVQMAVAKSLFLQKNLSEKGMAKARTDLEGQLMETFYTGIDKRPGGVGPRAGYYPLLMDSADRHPGTRSPRNALFVDGSVREAIQQEEEATADPEQSE
ncbi:MAG: type II secretion system GspH family protein [Planctomycetes bacterium]|nr:type II secretion system GspH family protein [Planctomycetota bacterium]